MLLVRKVEGPETAEAGEQATYRATAFNRVNPSEAEKRGINWLINLGNIFNDDSTLVSSKNGFKALSIQRFFF